MWSKLSESEGPSGSSVFRGGLGMACFSFLEASRMGRCLLTIFIKLVSLGWNVVTRGTQHGCVAVGGDVGLVDSV